MQGLELLATSAGRHQCHGKPDGMFSEEIDMDTVNQDNFPLRCYHVTYVGKHLNSQIEEEHRLLLHCRIGTDVVGMINKCEALQVSSYPLPRGDLCSQDCAK